jgi:hypothetical protein
LTARRVADTLRQARLSPIRVTLGTAFRRIEKFAHHIVRREIILAKATTPFSVCYCSLHENSTFSFSKTTHPNPIDIELCFFQGLLYIG